MSQAVVVDAAGQAEKAVPDAGLGANHANVALEHDTGALAGRIVGREDQPAEKRLIGRDGNLGQAIEALFAQILGDALHRLTGTVAQEDRPMYLGADAASSLVRLHPLKIRGSRRTAHGGL